MKGVCIDVYTKVVCGLRAIRKEERGAVDIVAIVVMIGIAVVLAVLFRKQIQGLLESLFESINTKANEAIS